MSAGFTPGPWKAERDLPHNRMPRVHGGDHSLICEVGNMGTPQDQWETNARLIAAAPELYEAARLFAEEYDAGDDDDGVAIMLAYNRALTAAKAALAKARGGR